MASMPADRIRANARTQRSLESSSSRVIQVKFFVRLRPPSAGGPCSPKARRRQPRPTRPAPRDLRNSLFLTDAALQRGGDLPGSAPEGGGSGGAPPAGPAPPGPRSAPQRAADDSSSV